jgi:hypothetical protein
MRTASGLALVTAIALVPGSASAVNIYLNGVRADGLAGVKIDKCSVQFDPKGNVHLDCPGYAVRAEGGAALPAPVEESSAKLSRRYFLVTEQAQPGATDFDIEVFVNSKFIRRLRNGDDQQVEDITKHLQPGKNVVMFTAKKKVGEARKSFSPEHYYRVLIGEGAASSDKVVIDDTVITFKRTAAEDKDVSEEFTLTTR